MNLALQLGDVGVMTISKKCSLFRSGNEQTYADNVSEY